MYVLYMDHPYMMSMKMGGAIFKVNWGGKEMEEVQKIEMTSFMDKLNYFFCNLR